jgi:uncharacterized protein
MPPLPGLRVIRSPIHGYGVVAARAFLPGEVIADVDGVPWRESDPDRDDTYSLWLGGGWLYDMVDQTRWINHSCAPNAEVQGDVDDAGQAWARLIALRPIAEGEEILYDYGFSAAHAEPCSCGASSCRGWIVDEEELPLLRRRRRTA